MATSTGAAIAGSTPGSGGDGSLRATSAVAVDSTGADGSGSPAGRVMTFFRAQPVNAIAVSRLTIATQHIGLSLRMPTFDYWRATSFPSKSFA